MGYKVIVRKNGLNFAASHFITYEGKCEFLHGHNYGVSIELDGSLTDDSFVFDFVALKKTGREICDLLDHHFLLAIKNKNLVIQQREKEWEIDYKNSHYAFPEKDVMPLPIDNITAERLAEYISGELIRRLLEKDIRHLSSLTVGVEETEGQAAYYTINFAE